MPQISVIVPVYKVEAYIHLCVDSILAQTFTDFELILVDDGSPDLCGVICDEYAKKDNRIHVVHQKNAGLSAARNTGLDIAQGDYITFIDSDDVIHPRFLELLIDDTQDKKNDITICQVFSFEESIDFKKIYNSSINYISSKEACERMYKRSENGFFFVTACGKLYIKELFQDIRYPVGRLHEDQFVTYKLLYAANKVGLINEPLYGYRNNPTSITNTKFSIKRYDDLDALNEAIDFFNDKQEFTLSGRVQKRINWTIAANSFYARQSGIYNQVKKEYRLSVRKATNVLVAEWGLDAAEYFVYQFNPNYIKCRSIVRKIKSMVSHS
ncbi:MAG: glycosyltransferase [Aeriscardovia sp.]|nr:glycosyltransferase [Aeriscardovia sp.]